MACRSALRRTNELLITLGLVTILVLPAYAATLNGTVTIAPEMGRQLEQMELERAGKLKQFYWRVPNGAVAPTEYQIEPSRDLAVILEAASVEGTPPAGQPQVVSLEGGALNPSVVVITPQTKVRFRNTDAFVYELECPENAQMENTAPLPPGNQVDITFDEEGVYLITDRRLPHLVGWVVVVNSTMFRNPEQAKRGAPATFSFEDVQPGSYKVKVFFAGDWVAEQQVEVPEEQEEVGVQIRLPSDGQQHEQEGENASAEAGQ